jgi:L,D-transpeptidase catalytic domain
LTRSIRKQGSLVAALALASSVLAAPVPFWGAKESEPVGTDPSKLKPGQFIWDAGAAPEGPLVVVVSLPEQMARVYRNGLRIGVTTVSTGKPGHTTPTGIFTILNKDKDHRSKTYDDAPMPYSERLTWDGVALHAGGLPGFPESHGCVHMPTRFAELLFGITNVGMTVVIANDSSAPRDVSHPGFLAPVDAKTGKPIAAAPLPADLQSVWQPAKSPEGPVTMVVSSADLRILVLRGGVEIGRARITIDDAKQPLGTEAFILKLDSAAARNPESPVGTSWIGIALPGSGVGAGAPLDLKDAARVHVADAFRADVIEVLVPGATLYVTDAPVLPETTGPRLNVMNADPPPATPPPAR